MVVAAVRTGVPVSDVDRTSGAATGPAPVTVYSGRSVSVSWRTSTTQSATPRIRCTPAASGSGAPSQPTTPTEAPPATSAAGATGWTRSAAPSTVATVRHGAGRGWGRDSGRVPRAAETVRSEIRTWPTPLRPRTVIRTVDAVWAGSGTVTRPGPSRTS